MHVAETDRNFDFQNASAIEKNLLLRKTSDKEGPESGTTDSHASWYNTRTDRHNDGRNTQETPLVNNSQKLFSPTLFNFSRGLSTSRIPILKRATKPFNLLIQQTIQ